MTESEPALVMAGAWSMVSVKLWVTVPTVLVAVTERLNTPATVGVPASVAVPSAPATKLTPVGWVPVSVTAGAG